METVFHTIVTMIEVIMPANNLQASCMLILPHQKREKDEGDEEKEKEAEKKSPTRLWNQLWYHVWV